MQNLMASEKAEYKVFISKKWTFDEKDIYPEPFDPKTVQLAREFWQLCKKHETDIYGFHEEWVVYTGGGRNGDSFPSDPPDLKTMAGYAKGLMPIVDAWIRMASQPDYDFEVLSVVVEPKGQKYVPMPNLYRLGMVMLIPEIRIQRLNDQNKQQEALDLLERFIAGMKSTPYAPLVSNVSQIGWKNRFIPLWHEAVAGCSNPDRLRRTLAAQQEAMPADDLITSGTQQIVRDFMGSVRIASRAGYRDPGVQGKTAFQLCFYMAIDQRANYLENVILPQLDPAEKPETEMLIEDLRTNRDDLSVIMDFPVLFIDIMPKRGFFSIFSNPLLAPAIYTHCPFGEHNPEGLHRSQKSFDLLRIHTAARIYQLETGKLPDKLEDLVPQYLDSIPTDRLNPGKPYPDGEWKQFFEKEE